MESWDNLTSKVADPFNDRFPLRSKRVTTKRFAVSANDSKESRVDFVGIFPESVSIFGPHRPPDPNLHSRGGPEDRCDEINVSEKVTRLNCRK